MTKQPQRYDSVGRRIKPLPTRQEWLDAIIHDKLSFSGKPYDYSTVTAEYISSGSVITYICPDHGQITVGAYSHKKCKCNQCVIKLNGLARRGTPNGRKFSLGEALAKAKDLHPDLGFTKVKEYSPKGTWEIECPYHGYYTHKVRSLLWEKTRGCVPCREARKSEISSDRSVEMRWQFDAAVAELGYTVLSYSGSHQPASLRCPTHGKFRTKRAYYIAQGSICPACRRGSSKPEVLLKSHLDSSSAGLGRIDVHRRDLLVNREIDIYLPRHKLGIEINGVRWHNTNVKSKNYHKDKTQAAEDAGLTLLHFTDIDIILRRNLVVSMIHAKCGIFKYRLGARETEVSPVSWSEVKEFLSANHMQGPIAGSTYLGLHAKVGSRVRLVAVAVFGKPRFNKKYSWELLRFATLRTCQVIGGLSKLVAKFATTHSGLLVSYADRFYSKGEAYSSSGFTLERATSPSYMWCKSNETYSRYQTQKHKLETLLDDFDPALSEAENMRANKFWCIYNAGNLVYCKSI